MTKYLTKFSSEWEMFQTKIVEKNQNTHAFYVQYPIFPENRAVYENMSKNIVDPERTQMTIWRRVACWISKATQEQVYSRKHARVHTHK
jgi:hypothetical protein